MITKLLAAIVCAACATISYAGDGTQERDYKPDRGYWFYEDPQKEHEGKEKKRVAKRKPLPPLPPYRELMEMHPEELRKVFKERLEEAVWKPTPQNVYAFMLVKDVARRKALAVTQMHSFLLLKYPNLNMNTARAVSTFARDTEYRMKMNAVSSKLAKERNRYALLYFRSRHCPYCLEQDSAIKFFRIRTGWTVKVIDVDSNPVLTRRLNVSITPTVILIRRGMKDYMPVAVGATSARDMEENIYRATRLLDGSITPQQFFTYEFDKGGLMDPLADPTEGRHMDWIKEASNE